MPDTNPILAFWQRLFDELGDRASRLQEIDGGTRADVRKVSTNSPLRVLYQVTVARIYGRPQMVFAEMAYKEGERHILCRDYLGNQFVLELCENLQGEASVQLDQGGLPMNPEQAATFILDPMVRAVSGARGAML